MKDLAPALKDLRPTVQAARDVLGDTPICSTAPTTCCRP